MFEITIKNLKNNNTEIYKTNNFVIGVNPEKEDKHIAFINGDSSKLSYLSMIIQKEILKIIK